MKAKKKRLTWNASPSPDVVGYRVYWSKAGKPDYNSDHAEVGNITQIILPDDIPAFPVRGDQIELGITAVNIKGNESDMARVSLQFQSVDVEENTQLIRLRQGIEGWEPPLNACVLIDGLNYCVIENAPLHGSLSGHTRYFHFESHYIEEWPIKIQKPQEIQKAASQA
jgi:hypothetical protein